MKKTRWVFRKICEISLKIANGTIFALPCDWSSKNQQNVQKNGVLKKLDGFFRKKLLKIARFAVECDWISKCSQNVKKLGFLLKNNEWVFRKKFDFFLNAKSSIFVVKCDWKTKTSQNVQKMASVGKN